MPAKATYQPNRQGFHQVANSAEIKAALTEVATKGLAHGKEVAADFVRTGDYEDRFGLEETTVVLGGKARDVVDGARACVNIINDSAHAVEVEIGTHGGKGAHHVFQRISDFLIADAG